MCWRRSRRRTRRIRCRIDRLRRPVKADIAPRNVVDLDNKKKARLNRSTHLLAQVPYQEMEPAKTELAQRQRDETYVRPPIDSKRWVPKVY
jgi:polyphosphate kinase